MSVNVKQNGELVKIANNISMVQANWNETDTSKTSCIRNKPETLKTLQEINDNTDENALVSANAVKELADSIDGTSNIVYLTKEQYEALPDSKLTDGVEYRITDANTTAKIDATDVAYGDSTVQEVISEVNESLIHINSTMQGYSDNGNSYITYYNVGKLITVLSFAQAKIVVDFPANSEKVIFTLTGSEPQYTTWFTMSSTDGRASIPCRIETNGDVVLCNYTGQNLKDITFYGQLVYVRK